MKTFKEIRDSIMENHGPDIRDQMIDLCERLMQLETDLNRTANVASCLANGITPD